MGSLQPKLDIAFSHRHIIVLCFLRLHDQIIFIFLCKLKLLVQFGGYSPQITILSKTIGWLVTTDLALNGFLTSREAQILLTHFWTHTYSFV
jgi:hypothetical protein